jgi:hypothetical protein
MGVSAESLEARGEVERGTPVVEVAVVDRAIELEALVPSSRLGASVGADLAETTGAATADKSVCAEDASLSCIPVEIGAPADMIDAAGASLVPAGSTDAADASS